MRRLLRIAREARRQVEARGLKGALRLATDRAAKLPVLEFGLRRFILPFRVRHLHGPQCIKCAHDEIIAITVVRNGELWVRTFLDHHRSRGVRHFVFLDNGSTDRTIERLLREPDVTLLATDAPYNAYENTMKRYLARRFCRGAWCLCIDIDELFDFPFSERSSIAAFLGYLNAHRYNAVITQMLDRFSDTPLAHLRSEIDDDLREKHRFYDLSAIVAQPYFYPVPDNRLMMLRGGIRNIVFGTMNGLTKVSLFRMDGELKPFVQWHHVDRARVADVSAVLLHFPFVSSFYRKVADAVETGRYGYLTSDEYASYWRSLQNNPRLSLKQETARVYKGVDELVDDGFLVASDRYAGWLSAATRELSRDASDAAVAGAP